MNFFIVLTNIFIAFGSSLIWAEGGSGRDYIEEVLTNVNSEKEEQRRHHLMTPIKFCILVNNEDFECRMNGSGKNGICNNTLDEFNTDKDIYFTSDKYMWAPNWAPTEEGNSLKWEIEDEQTLIIVSCHDKTK